MSVNHDSPVDILLNLLRHLEVDDVSDVVDVEPSGCDGRGDQNGMLSWIRENTGLNYKIKTTPHLS